MNTVLIVLSAFLGQAEDSRAPVWQQNYSQAEKIAARENKPVAVFLMQGQNGITTLIPEGLNERAREILAQNYVPVMVDTTKPEGQRLARAFEIRGGQGLVLSDRGGAYQALWYQGNLTNKDLIRNLQKYANQTNIRMTEVTGRASLYPPTDEQGNPVPQINTTPSERQRGIRLFQGRMFRRSGN